MVSSLGCTLFAGEPNYVGTFYLSICACYCYYLMDDLSACWVGDDWGGWPLMQL